MATVVTTIWDVGGGLFTGVATYDDTNGKIASILVTNNDTVPHSVIVTWKGTEFPQVVLPGLPVTYNPPNNVKWGSDQFDIRTN